MKRIISLLIMSAIVLSFIPAAAPAAASSFKPITGWDMMKELGIGINIANTMDARPWGCEPEKGVNNACANSVCPRGYGHCDLNWSCEDRRANLCTVECTPQQWNHLFNNHMETETCWGQPKIEKWHFEAIKQKGFDHVRIPITWELHMNSNRKIDAEWMARVKQCVDWALEAGLYVVINTHHERSTSQSLYNLSSHSFEGARDWLVDVWTQIAGQFKDYSEKLIFEPMNEPYPRATHGWFWDYDVFADEIPPYANRVNQMNRAALDVIRKSGGNNSRRVVQLAVIQASSYLLQYYEPPPNDPYTMVGIFYYQDYKLEHIKPALDKGIPVYVKETGPIDMQTSGVMSNSAAWVKEYIGLFASMGIPCAWWSSFTGNDLAGLQDRVTGKWNKPMVDAFFAAYGRTAGPDMPPPAFSFPYTFATSIIGGNYIYWIAPVASEAIEKMIVEFTGTGTQGGYSFSIPDPSWRQFDDGHNRVTVEPGKITFDLRGIMTGARLGFAAWDDGFASRITRIYIDTWEGSSVASDTPSLANFTKTRSYTPGTFDDIYLPDGSNEWYTEWIQRAYEYGLISGRTGTKNYDPRGDLTGAEALTIGARLHATYKYGAAERDTKIDAHAKTGDQWYDRFVLYCKAEGLIGNQLDSKLTVPITRSEMVFAWSKLLDAKDLPKINTVNSIPDVAPASLYANEIISFYEAGILTGSGDTGIFNPNNNINRAECAVIFMRLVEQSIRTSGRVYG